MQKVIFSGQVNDRKFTNRDEMSKYIQYCIDNNIDITNMVSHNETRWVNDDAEQLQSGCRCRRHYQHSDNKPPRIAPWPTEYATLADYLAPYVNENAFCADSELNKNIANDTVSKLEGRMKYYIENIENNYTLDCRNYNTIMNPVLSKLDSKSSWCSNRIMELTAKCKNNEERIKRLQAEIDELNNQNIKSNAIINAYDEVGGFCECLKDRILESDKFDASLNQ